jgi:Polysaccharide pyruvyl transferase
VNDGSIMQSYSLYRLLQRELPEARIEIIDYMPLSLHRRHWKLALYAFRRPFFNPRYVWSYYSQTAFLRRHCRFSSKRLISDDLEEAQQFITAQGYDAVVVGSDNVWEVGRPPLPPNAYFRPAPGIPTFAFAPSADPAPAADSPWCNEAAGLKQAIESFEIITVRDEGTRHFLRFMGVAPDRIGHLPDPTILWDFGNLVDTRRQIPTGGKSVAALAASPGLARSIQRHLMDAGFSVVSLMGARQLENVISPPLFSTIERRLGLYPSFDVTITDRFHMSVFAIKHGRGPVLFLEDAARWPLPNSKGRDLFARLGLEEMVWRLDESNVSSEKLRALLAAWPQASRGLRERLAALRADAERTGYSGIVSAMKAIAARKPPNTSPQ